MSTFIFILTAAWFFFCGCALGSFYNVLVDRLPNGQDIVKARSECSFCHTQLRWYDLIPVFSFLFLKGRCRYCGKRLSYQYLLSELSVGGLFLLAFFLYSSDLDLPQLIARLALWSMLFVIAVMDQKYGIIIDQILLAFSSVGITAELFGGTSVSEILLGAAVGFFLYGLIYLSARFFYKKEGFGSGDVLLLTAAGTFLGPVQTMIAGFLAFYCCLLFILIQQFKNRKSVCGVEIPFGPPVCLAIFVMSLWGEEISTFLKNLLGF